MTDDWKQDIEKAFERWGFHDRSESFPSPNGHNPLSDQLASTVEMAVIHWLWPGRLALGMLSGLDGDPELGKSQLVAYEAGCITTGRPWFDGSPCPLGGVVIVCGEDPVASVLVPRLTAAGADLSRVLILSTTPDTDGIDRLISLPQDVSILEDAIRFVNAKLIAFDPVTSYLSLNLNANADKDVRQALTPLAEMLDRVQCAGQMLRHHSKDNKVSNALYRGLGSIAFNALARTAMTVAKDKDDSGTFILAMTKSNIARKPKARRYSIEEVKLDKGITTARIAWGKETDHQAEELTTAFGAYEKKKADGHQLLRDLLADGPVDSKIILQAFEDAGVSRATAFNYKKQLGIRAQKKGFGLEGGWEWSWPEAESKLDSSTLRPSEEQMIPKNQDIPRHILFDSSTDRGPDPDSPSSYTLKRVLDSSDPKESKSRRVSVKENETLSNGLDLLASLRSKGFKVHLGENGRLMVGPASLLDEEDRALIAADRESIIAALEAEEEALRAALEGK